MRIRGITAITILTLMVIPITLFGWGFFLPAVYPDTFMGELPEKVRILKETESPRIIIAGGSAAAFGLDSTYMEQELSGYNVVNFGMYAGLGTRAVLDLTKDELARGDIVIVMPEQQAQSLSDYFGAEYFWQAADGHFELLKSLSGDCLREACGAFPAFAAGKCRYASQKALPEPDAVYRKSAFAANGDLMPGVAVSNRMPGGFDINTPILFDDDMVTQEFTQILNAYCEAAAKRGAICYYHFPPMNGMAVTQNAYEKAPGFTDNLQSRLVCQILGDPRDSIMDAEYFFDTNFHLTDRGREVFTRQLIRDIKAELGDFSRTRAVSDSRTDSADAVSTDSLPIQAAEHTDDSSVVELRDDLFIYEIQGGVAALCGLTDEGGMASSITVAAEIEGYPVEIIKSPAFAGHPELRSIRIPAGVRMIGDGAFAGCTGLREIIMESDTPEKCLVGSHLLDGTDASVIVPDRALSAYRLNYSWSVWSDRIRSESGDLK